MQCSVKSIRIRDSERSLLISSTYWSNFKTLICLIGGPYVLRFFNAAGSNLTLYI